MINAKQILSFLAIGFSLSVNADVPSYADIITAPGNHPVEFMQGTFIPRASLNNNADWGYFPDNEDILISPGSKHHANGTSAVIVGRWRTPEGYPYLILNAGYKSHPVFLRTRREFDLFLNNFVPRTTNGISACALVDESYISCAPQVPGMTFNVSPKRVPRRGGEVTYDWNTTGYKDCEINTFATNGYVPAATSGSGVVQNSKAHTYRLTCVDSYTLVSNEIRRRVRLRERPSRPGNPPSTGGGGSGGCDYSPAVCDGYRDVLGRDPDPEGGAWYEDGLESGDIESGELEDAIKAGAQGDRDCNYLGSQTGKCRP